MTITKVVLFGVLILSIAAVPARASLEEQIRHAEDGEVRVTFESRAGVCGDGHGSISFGRDYHEYRHRGRTIIHDSDDGDWWYYCEEGPVRVSLRVRDGEVSGVRTVVGGEWRPDDDVTDLGWVDPGEAADFLLTMAVEGSHRDASDAILGAVLARDVVVWPRLLEVARDRSVNRDTRKSSVFWLGQIAGEKATEGLAKLVDDDDVELEVRKAAIFSLSQQESSRSVSRLVEIARTNPHPQLRKSALFWLAQSDDPRVLGVFEDILTDE
jgi:hypothetical protein